MNFWRKIICGCQALSLDCRQASRAQSEAIEHPLPRGRRLGVWLHLLICKWCRRYGKQIRFLHDAAREHQEEFAATAPDKLSTAARERIKGRLREGG